jgi:hypothetical protein
MNLKEIRMYIKRASLVIVSLSKFNMVNVGCGFLKEFEWGMVGSGGNIYL